MTYAIRPLRLDEWEALRDIRLEALRDHPGFFFGTLERELSRTEADWKGWLTQDKKCAFGLFSDADLVGLISIVQDREDPSGQIAIIVANYIKPAHRGKGLARQLYQACFDWALTQPYLKTIAVSHRDDNNASRGTILSCGFQEAGRDDMVWPDGITAQNIWYGLPVADLAPSKA